ncbi:MAG: DUF3365 domain-containing protein, partial [Euryarchaeota archaeon]|nr:DUF3365 domain-containing protein [Euryarchaeota archaeon]
MVANLRLKLGTKFMLALGLVVAIAMSSIFFWMYEQNKEHIFREVDKQAKIAAGQIVITRQWIAEYGGVYVQKLPGVESNPYLVNPDIRDVNGTVYTLKNPALVTRELSEYSEKIGLYSFRITSLKPINPKNAPNDFERNALLEFERGIKEISRIETINGSAVYRYMTPLYVSEPCLQCHAAQGYKVGDVRGGISVFLPMQEAYLAIQTTKRNLLFSAIAMIFVLEVAVFYLTRNLVAKPICKLSKGAEQIGKGNLDYKFDIQTRDEVEALADTFNKMTSGLKKSYGQIALMRDIDRAILSTLDIDEILSAILVNISKVIPCNSANVTLLEKEELHVIGSFANGEKKIERGLRIPIRAELCPVIRDKKPLICNDITRENPCSHCAFNSKKIEEGIRSTVIAPLIVKEKVIGTLNLGSIVKGAFAQEHIHIAQELTNQTAIALENARLVEDLDKSYEELKTLDQLKNNIVANVSHELRTPITVVKGAIELAIEEKDEEKRNELLAMGRNALLRQNRIVGDLIDVARIERSAMKLRFESIDLRQVIEEATQEMLPLAMKSEVKIKTSLPSLQVKANLDERRHVLSNLIDNAIKFNKKGGEVLIEAKRKGEFA